MSEAYVVPVSPDSFLESSGLLDDVDVVIKSIRWKAHQLGAAKKGLYLAVDYTPNNGALKPFTDYLSAGSLDRFAPTSDGSGITKVGTASALKKDCNAAIYLAHAVDTDSTGELLASLQKGDVTWLDGKAVHLRIIAAPQRGPNITSKPFRVIDGYNNSPASRNGSKATSTSSETDNDDLVTEAQLTVLSILEDNPQITKATLGQKAFGALEGNPNRKAVHRLITDANFLKAEKERWTFDGKYVRAIAEE